MRLVPVDPQLQPVLDLVNQPGMPAFGDLSPEETRALMASFAAPREDDGLASVDDGEVAGVPVRWYRPHGASEDAAFVWLHGGGWVIGSVATSDATASKLAAASGVTVCSVDYRLAPEHPFPAAVDDCFAALQWVGEHGAEIGGDPSRIAVCGDSAGGNLSTVTSILARDNGGPDVCFQALIYPTTDARADYPSVQENGDSIFLSADSMQWFYEHYQSDKLDWRASPILAEDLSNLPPALIITAEYDTLRDEGEAYGEALREAGNNVTVRRYDGMTHVFVQLCGMLEDGRRAISEIAAALKVAYGTA